MHQTGWRFKDKIVARSGAGENPYLFEVEGRQASAASRNRPTECPFSGRATLVPPTCRLRRGSTERNPSYCHAHPLNGEERRAHYSWLPVRRFLWGRGFYCDTRLGGLKSLSNSSRGLLFLGRSVIRCMVCSCSGVSSGRLRGSSFCCIVFAFFAVCPEIWGANILKLAIA
jgi:hypothetical protein